MLHYDHDHLTPMLVDRLEVSLEQAAWVHPDELKKVSLVAGAICHWAHSMYLCGKALPVIEPCRKVLSTLQDEVVWLQQFAQSPTVALP